MKKSMLSLVVAGAIASPLAAQANTDLIADNSFVSAERNDQAGWDYERHQAQAKDHGKREEYNRWVREQEQQREFDRQKAQEAGEKAERERREAREATQDRIREEQDKNRNNGQNNAEQDKERERQKAENERKRQEWEAKQIADAKARDEKNRNDREIEQDAERTKHDVERNNDQNNHWTEAERSRQKVENERKRQEWEAKQREEAEARDEQNRRDREAEAERNRDQASNERNNDQNNTWVDAERSRQIAENERKRQEWEAKQREEAEARHEAERKEREEAANKERERQEQKDRDTANIDRNNDQNNSAVDIDRNNAKADALESAIDYAIDQNKEVVIDGVTYGGKELLEAKNMLASMSKTDRAEAIKQLEKATANSDIKVNDGKNNGGSNDAMEIEGAIAEVAAQYNSDLAAAQNWATQAEAQFKQEVARLDSKIDTMEGRVSNGTAMTGAMSQMQFGRDGLGIGAGVAEFNGSKAVAVGVGYAFGAEKQWMAKGSFGYAESKKGRGSKDTMAAAGLTYSFK